MLWAKPLISVINLVLKISSTEVLIKKLRRYYNVLHKKTELTNVRWHTYKPCYIVAALLKIVYQISEDYFIPNINICWCRDEKLTHFYLRSNYNLLILATIDLQIVGNQYYLWQKWNLSYIFFILPSAERCL